MTTDLAKSVKIDPHTGEISIMCDDRIAFTISVLDGHTIEVRGGQTVKDAGVIYTEQLQITPRYSNVVQVSKVEYV
jgi:hypothetical protein